MENVDLSIFKNHGIDDPNAIISVVADILRKYPELCPVDTRKGRSLSSEAGEVKDEYLRGEQVKSDEPKYKIQELALQYEDLIKSSLTATQVSNLLDISKSTVQRWRKQNKLFSIHPQSYRYLYPSFQFSGTTLIPGLEIIGQKVFARKSAVQVQRFFTTTNSCLKNSAENKELSPKKWLLSGLPVDAVLAITN